MAGGFAGEIGRMLRFSKDNGVVIAVLSVATLSLLASRYLAIGGHLTSTLIYYVAVPAAAALALPGRGPGSLGLAAGDPGAWRMHLPPALTVAVLLAVAARYVPPVREYYADSAGLTFGSAGRAAVEIFSVEFMFRGFILFGLRKKLGDGAAVVQMVPFALLHLHKPGLEAAGCVLTGTYLGYLSLRAGSIWPAFVIHLAAYLAVALVV